MKRLSERMADDGDMECYVFVEDVADLERDLDAERSRCQDLTARLDRARMELRAAEAARDEATRDRELVSVLVDAVRARLATAEANYQAVAEALGIMYEGDGCASAPGPVADCVAAIKDLRAFRDAEMERRADFDEACKSLVHGELGPLSAAQFSAAPVDTRTGTLSDEVLLELRNALDWVHGHCHADLEPYYERIIDAFEAAYPDIAKAHAEADGDAVDTRTGEVTVGVDMASGPDVTVFAEFDTTTGVMGPLTTIPSTPEATRERCSTCDVGATYGTYGREGCPECNGTGQPTAPEATREWAVGDACEVQVAGRWRQGTVSALVGACVAVDVGGWAMHVAPDDIRRPIPPTAMEPRMEGGRGLDGCADERCGDLIAQMHVAVVDKDARIADLERRLREAEEQRDEAVEAWNMAAGRADDCARERNEAIAKLRRVRSYCDTTLADAPVFDVARRLVAADVLAILDGGNES